MLALNGYGFVAYCLMNKQHLITYTTVNVVVALADQCDVFARFRAGDKDKDKHRQALVFKNIDAIKHLLFNFDCWSGCADTLQLYLVETVLYACTNGATLGDVISSSSSNAFTHTTSKTREPSLKRKSSFPSDLHNNASTDPEGETYLCQQNYNCVLLRSAGVVDSILFILSCWNDSLHPRVAARLCDLLECVYLSCLVEEDMLALASFVSLGLTDTSKQEQQQHTSTHTSATFSYERLVHGKHKHQGFLCSHPQRQNKPVPLSLFEPTNYGGTDTSVDGVSMYVGCRVIESLTKGVVQAISSQPAYTSVVDRYTLFFTSDWFGLFITPSIHALPLSVAMKMVSVLLCGSQEFQTTFNESGCPYHDLVSHIKGTAHKPSNNKIRLLLSGCSLLHTQLPSQCGGLISGELLTILCGLMFGQTSSSLTSRLCLTSFDVFVLAGDFVANATSDDGKLHIIFPRFVPVLFRCLVAHVRYVCSHAHQGQTINQDEKDNNNNNNNNNNNATHASTDTSNDGKQYPYVVVLEFLSVLLQHGKGFVQELLHPSTTLPIKDASFLDDICECILYMQGTHPQLSIPPDDRKNSGDDDDGVSVGPIPMMRQSTWEFVCSISTNILLHAASDTDNDNINCQRLFDRLFTAKPPLNGSTMLKSETTMKVYRGQCILAVVKRATVMLEREKVFEHPQLIPNALCLCRSILEAMSTGTAVMNTVCPLVDDGNDGGGGKRNVSSSKGNVRSSPALVSVVSPTSQQPISTHDNNNNDNNDNDDDDDVDDVVAAAKHESFTLTPLSVMRVSPNIEKTTNACIIVVAIFIRSLRLSWQIYSQHCVSAATDPSKDNQRLAKRSGNQFFMIRHCFNELVLHLFQYYDPIAYSHLHYNLLLAMKKHAHLVLWTKRTESWLEDDEDNVQDVVDALKHTGQMGKGEGSMWDKNAAGLDPLFIRCFCYQLFHAVTCDHELLRQTALSVWKQLLTYQQSTMQALLHYYDSKTGNEIDLYEEGFVKILDTRGQLLRANEYHRTRDRSNAVLITHSDEKHDGDDDGDGAHTHEHEQEQTKPFLEFTLWLFDNMQMVEAVFRSTLEPSWKRYRKGISQQKANKARKHTSEYALTHGDLFSYTACLNQLQPHMQTYYQQMLSVFQQDDVDRQHRSRKATLYAFNELVTNVSSLFQSLQKESYVWFSSVYIDTVLAKVGLLPSFLPSASFSSSFGTDGTSHNQDNNSTNVHAFTSQATTSWESPFAVLYLDTSFPRTSKSRTRNDVSPMPLTIATATPNSARTPDLQTRSVTPGPSVHRHRQPVSDERKPRYLSRRPRLSLRKKSIPSPQGLLGTSARTTIASSSQCLSVNVPTDLLLYVLAQGVSLGVITVSASSSSAPSTFFSTQRLVTYTHSYLSPPPSLLNPIVWRADRSRLDFSEGPFRQRKVMVTHDTFHTEYDIDVRSLLRVKQHLRPVESSTDIVLVDDDDGAAAAAADTDDDDDGGDGGDDDGGDDDGGDDADGVIVHGESKDSIHDISTMGSQIIRRYHAPSLSADLQGISEQQQQQQQQSGDGEGPKNAHTCAIFKIGGKALLDSVVQVAEESSRQPSQRNSRPGSRVVTPQIVSDDDDDDDGGGGGGVKGQLIHMSIPPHRHAARGRKNRRGHARRVSTPADFYVHADLAARNNDDHDGEEHDGDDQTHSANSHVSADVVSKAHAQYDDDVTLHRSTSHDTHLLAQDSPLHNTSSTQTPSDSPHASSTQRARKQSVTFAKKKGFQNILKAMHSKHKRKRSSVSEMLQLPLSPSRENLVVALSHGGDDDDGDDDGTHTGNHPTIIVEKPEVLRHEPTSPIATAVAASVGDGDGDGDGDGENKARQSHPHLITAGTDTQQDPQQQQSPQHPDTEQEQQEEEEDDAYDRVLSLLEPNEGILKDGLYVCARIAGLDKQDGIAVLGENNLYIIDNLSISPTGDMIDITPRRKPATTTTTTTTTTPLTTTTTTAPKTNFVSWLSFPTYQSLETNDVFAKKTDEEKQQLERFISESFGSKHACPSFGHVVPLIGVKQFNKMKEEEKQYWLSFQGERASNINHILSQSANPVTRAPLSIDESIGWKGDVLLGTTMLTAAIDSQRISQRQIHKHVKIPFHDIREVHSRRYQLQDLGLEVFLRSGGNFLLVFADKQERDDFYGRIGRLGQSVINADLSDSMSFSTQTLAQVSAEKAAGRVRLWRKSVTQRWMTGEISNFAYLMFLNTLAGRSYNDLTQYPVFPWILADYTSNTLDLNDPASYRDLTKPMGAIGEERAKKFQQRFNNWEDPTGTVPKFHYGTHYSSAASVLYYLIRLEPFTKIALDLQGGSFDHADRLFYSIAHCWMSSSSEGGLSDVKELIPEFFYLPEFLENRNYFDMGVTQKGVRVSDVLLPPWANNDARTFVRLHRRALESEYVSANLHHWIDLTFGYKQRGKHAEEAQNVFYYLTYEGVVDVDTIEDPIEKVATIAQINNFGQTPHQLFTKEHPKRKPWSPPVTISTHTQLLRPAIVVKLRQPVSAIALNEDKLVHLGGNKAFYPPKYHKYFSWGYADHTFRVCTLQPTPRHRHTHEVLCSHEGMHACGHITCVHTTQDGHTVVTGGSDSVVNVWTMHPVDKYKSLSLKGSLTAHSTSITAICSSTAYNILVTGGDDRQVFVWNLGSLALQYRLPVHPGPITSITINHITGEIVTASPNALFVWRVNGDLVAHTVGQVNVNNKIECVGLAKGPDWQDDNVIITGHTNGDVQFWRMDVLINTTNDNDDDGDDDDDDGDDDDDDGDDDDDSDDDDDDSDGSVAEEKATSVSLSSVVGKRNKKEQEPSLIATSSAHKYNPYMSLTRIDVFGMDDINTPLTARNRVLEQRQPSTPTLGKNKHTHTGTTKFKRQMTSPHMAAITVIYTSSSEWRKLWTGDANGVIVEWAITSDSHWVNDEDVAACTNCKKRFGVLDRRHHCRLCGLVFCAGCSNHRSPVLEFGHSDPVRVCGDCFSMINDTNTPQQQEQQEKEQKEKGDKEDEQKH